MEAVLCHDRNTERHVVCLANLSTQISLPITRTDMKILRALGFGIFLVIALILMPSVFSELTKTIIVFLKSSQEALQAAGIIAGYAGHIPSSLP